MQLAPTGPPLHAEVAAATARYRPGTAGLGAQRFARLESIVDRALDGLEPVVVVNRRLDSAERLLARGPDEPFDTIHTSPPSGPIGAARRAARLVTERLHGTHGVGEDAGRTVFGSTRFVALEDAASGAESVLRALQRQDAVGVESYGPVALVLDADRTWPRTTFAARDTAVGLVRVAHGSRLAPVVAERLALGAPGAPTPELLLATAPDDAVARVRHWLTSDALAHERGYIEAQVRGVRPTDVAALHVARGSSRQAPRSALPTIDPGPPPDDEAAARLLAVARSKGWATAES